MPLLPDPISAPNVKLFYLPKPDKDADGKPLPQDKQAWVKMDMQAVNGVDTMHQFARPEDPMGSMLTGRIREWNFLDEQGRPLPITYENVMRMGQLNLAYLLSQPLDQVPPLSEDQKKTSISTVTP